MSKFKFSVGPWNVHSGADAYGPATRDEIPFEEKIKTFKEMGFDAIQFHDDDAGIWLEGDFGNMYTREIESFCDSLINNKPLEVPASDAVHVQEIIEKAYRSTKENRIFEIMN